MNEIQDSSGKCPHCGQSQSVSVPAHRLKPNTVLSGRYIVGAAKGEGGFGITYIGRDTRLDRTVAVKEFFPSGLVNRNSDVSPAVIEPDDENAATAFVKGRDSFLTEAKTLAKFSGEMGIVHILDFFVENNTAYIVMEYLDGVSLSNKLKAEGTMTPEQTLTVLMPVMISLEKVHKQGLIHRDISPSNIMILQNTVKLIDFGAARQTTSGGNKSISLMLKPGYAPEEQYRSKGVQGPWTDVYALCATIYKCITGVTPDEANDRLHKDELKTPSQLGVSVEPGFEAALMKGLSVLQENRYQSIEELLGDISPFAISGGAKNASADDGNTAAFPSQEDQSTRFVAAVQSSQRTPVQSDAYRQSVQPAQVPQFQQAFQPQMPQQPQFPQPQMQPQFTQQPFTQPQTMQQPQYAQPQQVTAQPESDIDRKIAQRVRKRRQKKALTAFLIILGIAVIVLAVVCLMNKSGSSSGAVSAKEGEKLEPVSFKDNDASLNFNIDDNYASFYKTAVTPKDISQLKSRKGLTSIYFSQCQIPQETMDVLWELDGVTYLSFNKCIGFKDLSPLSKLTTIRNLQVEQCDMGSDVFKGLDFSKMNELYSFSAMGNPKLNDISFVKTAAEHLSSLDISYCEVADIAPVKELKKLYTFSADNCKISDISALKDLKMSRIQLSGNQIKDLSPLSGNKTLSTLDVSGNQIDSLKPLESCSELKSLNVGNNKLTSLTGLEKLIRLEKFECNKNQISDLGGITNCTALSYVNISSNKISDISLLAKSAQSLKSVFLDDNQVSDLSSLSSAKELLALSFNNNKITSLDKIKDCTKLRAISGDNNGISSLSELAPMTKLKCISFAHNKISDMSPIEKLTQGMSESMYVLDLSNNQISKLALASSKTYESVLVYSNPLTTLDNIKQIKGLTIAISYFEGIDLKEISKGYLRLSIIDCPLDKQLAIEKEVGRYSVTFSTSEEKEKDTKQKKEAVFKQINSF